jgi:hypothetical protein
MGDLSMKQFLLHALVIVFLFAGCIGETDEPVVFDLEESAPIGEAALKEDEGNDSKPDETQPSSPSSNEPPSNTVTVDEPETIPPLLPKEEYLAGWIRLFDGYSRFGWECEQIDRWEVTEEGVLTSPAEADPSILVTTVPWTDYELVLEYRLEAGGNSGIFLRTIPNPTGPEEGCYELNLCDTHNSFKTGSIVAKAQPIAEAQGDGGWHTMRILCEENWIQAWLDDVHVTDFHDQSASPLLSGRIGLQKNAGKIEFRNIKLQPYSLMPLFAGESLERWQEVPGSKSSFVIEEETIHVSNGPGFLETRETFGDFVLQADYRINGDGLNSGIFFRAKKGTEEAPSHGYEFQIHNGYENGDPRQPADQGAGAIFRRVKARRVVSQDHEWNAITLNASGNRFATWVNGYQTAFWVDTRESDVNPRRGRRDDAGHLSLQGHDSTTDLNYREIRIAPHPE